MDGRIIKGVGGFYTVYDGIGTYTLKARGAFRYEKTKPIVGDIVEFTPGQGEAHGWIEKIQPRKNALKRPPVANIDVVMLQVAATNPQPDLMLLDKMMLISRQQKIDVAIVISKSDLNHDQALDIKRQYEKTNFPIFVVSSLTGEGLEDVREFVHGLTCAWAGQSGVGKSTLIGKLFGVQLNTGELSRMDRGRHTTRHIELLNVGNNTFVFDTPGFSLIDLPVDDPLLFTHLYPEFANLDQCKFKNKCSHINEPECQLQSSREQYISAERYMRYKLIFAEARKKWGDRYVKGFRVSFEPGLDES